MKKMIYILFIGMLFIFACNKNNQQQALPENTAVKVAAIEHKKLSEPVHASGILTNTVMSKLSFKIGGIIEKITVNDGETVRPGQILASLKLNEIQAQVDQARTGLEKSRRDMQRVKNLYADSVATLEQLQNMQAALSVAQSNADIAEFNLNHAVIRAPANGQILKRLAEPDELIGPGMPVFMFGTTGAQWLVRVGVADRDIVRLAIGDSAQVHFDAYPGTRFKGKVTELAGSADAAVGTFEIKVQIPQKEKFVTGLVASVDLYPHHGQHYALIPVEALVEADQNKGFVFVPDENNKVKKIPVIVGPIFDSRIGIIVGLEGYKSVVTDGCQYLSDGSLIQIVN